MVYIELNSGYIHDNKVLCSIYNDAVNKFLKNAEKEICFNEVCKYVFKKLIQRKQSVYDHSIMIVKEVCQKIGEDFWMGAGQYCPNAKNYRDIYISIYEY